MSTSETESIQEFVDQPQPDRMSRIEAAVGCLVIGGAIGLGIGIGTSEVIIHLAHPVEGSMLQDLSKNVPASMAGVFALSHFRQRRQSQKKTIL